MPIYTVGWFRDRDCPVVYMGVQVNLIRRFLEKTIPLPSVRHLLKGPNLLRIIYWLILFFLLFPSNLTLSAQSFSITTESAAADDTTRTASSDGSPLDSDRSGSPTLIDPAELPIRYRAFTLGMGLEELKQALSSDDLFAFRGDRDVSLLPLSEQTLVETTGLSFIKRAFFQLKDGKVFIMAFTLNSDTIDHYSVFTTLVQKYGEPKELNPREAVWLSERVRLSLERPLTVKYIDVQVFSDIVEASAVKESKEAILRKEFLNDF